MNSVEEQQFGGTHLTLGTPSPTPWDFSLSRQNESQGGSRRHSFRPLGRRSGRIPALPYPPPRYRQYKSEAESKGGLNKKLLQGAHPVKYKEISSESAAWPVFR